MSVIYKMTQVRRPVFALSFSLMVSVLVSSCAYMTQGGDSREELAVVTKADFFGDSADKIMYADQNWSSSESLWFYNTTQGSDLLPLNIMLNLEQAQNETPFLATKNIEKFRYLPQRASKDNEHGLPVGWVANSYLGRDYVGFTCAACHTSQINYKGVGMRIDGAPALADMESMLIALEASLAASQASVNAEKFDRLARKAGQDKSVEDKNNFSALLATTYKDIKFYNCANKPVHGPATNTDAKMNRCSDSEQDVVHYGYGRLDAIGRIYNRTLLHIGGKDSNGNLIETTKTISPTAPVSYPFLWDTPQHDFVQWNGLLPNDLGFLGALGRNTGEVVGVFATIDIDVTKSGKIKYPSSVEVRNLIRLEDHLKALWSPRWEDMTANNSARAVDLRGTLPAIVHDCGVGVEVCASKGEQLFKEYACKACHQPIVRDSGDRNVIAQLSSLEMIKTDPNMARQAIEACGNSGLLLSDLQKKGTSTCPANQAADGEFDPQTAIPALSAVNSVTGGALKDGIFNSVYLFYASAKEVITSLFDGVEPRRHVDFEVVNKDFLNAYKARPLNGIWATAPYLHNGSVPNLYDLLLPACAPEQVAAAPRNSCRPERFTVGRREFDPVNVGFVSDLKSDLAVAAGAPSLFIFDTQLYGNRNGGHEYASGKDPVPLVDEQGDVLRNADGKVKGWHTMTPLNHIQRLSLVEYMKTL